VIVEIVRPGTGDPVPEGEVGEVVVTVLNPDYPLIRFGTGDLSAVLPEPAPPAAATPASRAGWAAPTRRPRCAACSCTRARWPRWRAATPRCAARLVVAGEMANDRMTLWVEVRRRSRRPGRASG
jgi:phenylacetate-CoA ligase